MGLLRVKAKVKLISEDDLEVESKIGEMNCKSEYWAWRKMGIRAENIYEIISYSPNKCLIITYDDGKILVAEAFDTLFAKWEKADDWDYEEAQEDLTIGKEPKEDEEDNEDD